VVEEEEDDIMLDDNSRGSLPNCAHHDSEDDSSIVPFKKQITPFSKTIVMEASQSQPIQHWVRSNFLKNHHPVSSNMFVEDMPVYKLVPFTTGAYVNKCINEKLLLHCKIFQDQDDIDKLVSYVLHKI